MAGYFCFFLASKGTCFCESGGIYLGVCVEKLMLTKPCVIAGGEWEMRWRMLLREKGGFVEIDIAAWLSTNGS
jgi:hypothetical protein